MRSRVAPAGRWPPVRCCRPSPALLQRRAGQPPPEVAAALPGARLQGDGQLRFLGLRVYDMRLWAGAPARRRRLGAALPLALEIEYARDCKARRSPSAP